MKYFYIWYLNPVLFKSFEWAVNKENWLRGNVVFATAGPHKSAEFFLISLLHEINEVMRCIWKANKLIDACV